MDKNKFNKKRLLYNNSEDLYFLTYNTLLILFYLDCKKESKSFKDYRKLAFLIPIISDEKKTTLLLDYYKNKTKPNRNIYRELNRMYYESLENIALIRYVLLILEKREIVVLVNDESKTNIYLNDFSKYEVFIKSARFKGEKERILELKSNISRLKTINYMTFVENFFKVNGVVIWEN
ncbi:hypothetical protein LXM56_13560 [Lysinibacillus fusiformis]|uniref:hypothetical protein n=1 Tax=Lysinibacillus fusiformis TaxID=28031 RepID=UPI001E4F3EAA|nr:hypothetical protein [Lysinibacillus fusiformis]MCE4045161.1 hypothetical protein [Lysinibacillus fusiformis]